PDIATDIMQSVAVCWKLRDRRDARKSVSARVLIGKISLMGVGHPLAALSEVVTPGIEIPRKPAACRKLPLRFRGQPFPRPQRICLRIFIRNVHDRKPFFPFDRTCRTQWMAPVRTIDKRPPLKVVIEWDRLTGRRKDH